MIEIVELPPAAQLEAAWLDLELRAAPTFFRSWSWIGTWLASLPATLRPLLVRATLGGRTVGLATLCARRVTRGAGIIRSRGLWLNSTGDPYLDELTIEYNAPLCEIGVEREVAGALAQALLARQDWDELFIDGAESLELIERLCPKPLRCTSRVRPDYYVDLAALRDSRRPYVESLKGDVRRNLKRTIKDAETLGKVTFEVAASVAQAEEFLAALGPLSTRSWQARGKRGAFTNPYFAQFHATLVRSRFDAGVIQMCRLAVAGRAVGYLYNFVHRGRVYVYQNGFDLAFDHRHSWRPGMLCHVHAIEHSRARGLSTYDFMAGEHEYKRQMSTAAARMAWAVIQRPRIKFGAESLLRRAREAGRALFPA